MRILNSRLEGIVKGEENHYSTYQERYYLAMDLLEARKVLKDIRRVASKEVMEIITKYFAKGG